MMVPVVSTNDPEPKPSLVTTSTTRVAPKDEQLASNFPPQVEPLFAASNFTPQVADQAALSRSSTKQLSPKELAVLEKLAQQMIVSGKTVALLKGEPLKRPEGFADLVKRGRELISAGKIGDARMLLRIAADANDGT